MNKLTEIKELIAKRRAIVENSYKESNIPQELESVETNAVEMPEAVIEPGSVSETASVETNAVEDLSSTKESVSIVESDTEKKKRRKK